MKKENMYIVIKREDALRYLTEVELQSLETILSVICEGRSKDGKEPFNTYYMCNTDEPYADFVHGAILAGEASKNSYQASKNVDMCECGNGSGRDYIVDCFAGYKED